ncbi:MAG: hypothetical protein O2816_07655 [Planctomycetota bacterium]|nr:hypothetical protein [Planctomycetota bacterium]
MSPFVRRPTVRHADRVLARSVFALVLAVLTGTMAVRPGSDAGEVSFQTTRSIAGGQLTLAESPEVAVLDARHRPPDEAVGVLTRDQEGRLVPCGGLAHPLVGVPFYALGYAVGSLARGLEELPARRPRGADGAPETSPEQTEFSAHLIVSWRGALLTAATAWLLVLITRRLGGGRRTAWLAGLTYPLTTFAWAQAGEGLAGPTGAFALVTALHYLLRVRERYERFEAPQLRVLLCIGGALGIAWASDMALRPAALVMLAAAEVIVARGDRRVATSRWSPKQTGKARGGAAFAAVVAPLLVIAAVQGWLDQVRFGSFWVHCPAPAGGHAGLGEWTIAPGRGLLWTAPMLLLAPFGLRRLWGEGERLFLFLLAALIVAIVWPALVLGDPSGRWSFGPRPLLPLLPFLWVSVGLGLTWAAKRLWSARAALALALFGLIVQVPTVLVDDQTYRDLTEQLPARGAEDRWSRAAWNIGHAAPWVQWRVLRHRVSGLDESFEADQLFRGAEAGVLTTKRAREHGFRHLAWVALAERDSSATWIPVLLLLVLAVWGAAAASAGLDPGRD